LSQYFKVHPQNPQPRLISQAASILRAGGIVVYPTDSCYALGCLMGDKAAMERIRRIRRLDDHHNFTLVCRDLSEIATYAQVDNAAYRLIRSLTPGPYTFILRATEEVPRRLQNPRRKTIGLRVPDHAIVRALLEALGEPIMSVTLVLPDAGMPLTDPDEIRAALEKQVDLVIDGGFCGLDPTTVVDLVSGAPEITRKGKGDTSGLTA
jgi:tRNA threonylcarbamoyl adenosine modification protein (Sua5/YciO/YrdC/YwlC family)